MNVELQKILERFGLTRYELVCYQGLIELGAAKAKALCKSTSIPYGRIYDILHTLADKGLVSVIPTKPQTFKVVDPQLAFPLILQKKEEELQQLKKALSEVKLKPVPVYETKDMTAVFRGKEQQFDVVRHFYKTVKKELVSISRNFNPDVAYKTVMRHAMSRKVSIKIIIRRLTQENKTFVNECMKNNVEFRQKEVPGLRLVVKDGEEMLLSIVDPKTNDRFSVYSNNKEFASSMTVFFNTLWKSCDKM